MLWGAGGVAAAMLALTGYMAVTSGDDATTTPGKNRASGTSASPTSAAPSSTAPTYTTPDDWTEPDRWAALPRGKRTDSHGNDVGFPHTTEGAVAMLAAYTNTSMDGSHSVVDEQVSTYESYMAAADQTAENTAKVKTYAVKVQQELLSKLGLTSEGDMPSGAYVRTNVVGFKVIKASQDEVSAYLLSRVTMKTGGPEKEQGSYTRTVLGAVWEAGDWKLSTDATVSAAQQAPETARPAMAAPGDAVFNDAGWTAIRAAS